MQTPLLCFKDFVPFRLRVALFILFSIIFQFANVTYLSLLGDVVGTNQFYKEDISFAYQVSTIGVTFIFPILFRIKFRYTSQQILAGCSLLLGLLMWVCMYTTSIPVLIICAFLIGALKMIGTFEALVSIQLILTKEKDYGIFFSIALGIILLCGQVSGTVGILLADRYDWRMIYNIEILLLACQVLVVLFLLKPYRMVKKLPLYGIDWWGIVHWSILFSLISYVLTYGQLQDWFSSEKIVLATCASALWALLVFYRTHTIRRALIRPSVFRLRNVSTAIILILIAQVFLNTSGSILGPFTGSIMHLDNLHTGALNWWIAGGVVAGAGFGFFWFKKVNGPFRIIFALGFIALTLHHALLYFSFSSYAGETQLYLPYFLKGFGNVILFAATGKYMTIGVGFEIFTQMLCYMAMFRNALGSTIMGAFFSNRTYALSQDYLQKLAANMDASRLQPTAAIIYNQSIKKGWSSVEASQLSAKAIYARVSREALLLADREIFGWVTVFGILVLAGICCYHFAAPFIRPIPSWRSIFTSVKRSAVSQTNIYQSSSRGK